MHVAIWLLCTKDHASLHQYSLLRARLGEGSTHGEPLLAIPLTIFNDLIIFITTQKPSNRGSKWRFLCIKLGPDLNSGTSHTISMHVFLKGQMSVWCHWSDIWISLNPKTPRGAACPSTSEEWSTICLRRRCLRRRSKVQDRARHLAKAVASVASLWWLVKTKPCSAPAAAKSGFIYTQCASVSAQRYQFLAENNTPFICLNCRCERQEEHISELKNTVALLKTEITELRESIMNLRMTTQDAPANLPNMSYAAAAAG